MKRAILALVILLLVLVLVMSGCSGTTVTTTQTEFQTITGPVSTMTVNVTGAATTTIMTTTIPGPTSTTTQVNTAFITTTATVSGPTTTLTTTKTAMVTQGFTYVSAITPASPATLHFNDSVRISVDYVITDAGGGKMWAIPSTNGQNTPNGGYSASGLVAAGRGTTNLSFFIGSGLVKVTDIHLVMQNSSGVLIFDAYIPVDYTYGP